MYRYFITYVGASIVGWKVLDVPCKLTSEENVQKAQNLLNEKAGHPVIITHFQLLDTE